MTTPADREFQVLRRGAVRDIILQNFRSGLRNLVNPETGALFTEDEIQRATQPGSRWYLQAQGDDDYAQGEQRRALFMADQIRAERASTSWLEDFHGRLWGLTKLPPTGGSGPASVEAIEGTYIVGSTTLGDPTAYQARDAAGNVYQVWITAKVLAGDTSVEVEIAAVDTGSDTNLETGDKLTWIKKDPNMKAQATVVGDFRGGTDQETDAEFASRVQGTQRHREGAGNDAQTRAWTRQASNAIEDAYVFPCAFHAGTTLIAITQKRGGATDPKARVPSPPTLAAAIAHMTPPASTVYPRPPHVLVTGVTGEDCNVVLTLALPRGSAAGWTDVTAFPAYHATAPTVTAKASNIDFTITCPGDATLPGQAALATLTGDDAPQMMLWKQNSSEFVSLIITSVEDLGTNQFRVILSAAPSGGVSVGQIVCPDTARRAIVGQALAAYFDERGPGNLFDIDTDPRGDRCVRFPNPSETRPYRAGAEVAVRVIEALGGSSADAEAPTISKTQPTYPTLLTDGPKMLVLGTAGVYAL